MSNGHTFFRYVAVAAVLACYVTILIGGNVMASDSGLACPDWPTCHGSLTPPLAGAAGIEWAHRLSAFVLSATIVVMCAAAIVAERSRPILVRLSAASAALVLAQAVLGGVVVESDLTVGLVLLHLGLATALFALLLVIALLANFREIPRRWLDFARRASEEVPPSVRWAESGPAPSGSPPAPEPSTSGRV
jgi:heme A synthase